MKLPPLTKNLTVTLILTQKVSCTFHTLVKKNNKNLRKKKKLMYIHLKTRIKINANILLYRIYPNSAPMLQLMASSNPILKICGALK